MSLTRRYFLKAAVGTAACSTRFILAADEKATSSSPNERLGAAVIGTGGRGGGHVQALLNRYDVDLLYLCDADTNRAGAKLKAVEQRKGKAPLAVQDFRRVLDDPRVNFITTATPNHWHSLISILAMQAGKHVYVEKPVSHNVWEGRQLVGWARELNKICQCGTQSRSSPSLHAAVQFVRDGELGKIEYVIGTCYKGRQSIGKLDHPLQIPDTVDYDLWCGPAAKVDLYRPRLDYDWHWDFNTGNGDMGNQGIHQMDIARWFLGESQLSPRVMSIGGRVGYEDAGNTPNTQIVYHAYPSAPLIFETRGLPQADLNWKGGMDRFRGSDVGVIVQCENGHVLVSSYTAATAFDRDGNKIQEWSVQGNADDRHFGNFVDAVHSGNPQDLNAEILEGHLSSALCHTGSISHRLGTALPAEEISKHVSGDALWSDSWQRMAEHLDRNHVDISGATLTLGPSLQMNPAQETFPGNSDANALLTREYRRGYEVPASPVNTLGALVPKATR